MSKNHEKLEEMAESLAVWIGSIQSLVFHTIFFILMFCLHFVGVAFSNILLIATTIVSFEAIYQNIFVQMCINHQSKKLKKHGEHLEKLSFNKK